MFEDQPQSEIDARRARDPEFRALHDQHRKLNKKCMDAELGVLPIDDVTLGRMKREKLLAKQRLLRMYETPLPTTSPVAASKAVNENSSRCATGMAGFLSGLLFLVLSLEPKNLSPKDPTARRSTSFSLQAPDHAPFSSATISQERSRWACS